VCPKAGKYLGHKRKYRWLMWVFPIAGLLSLIWFLIRVVPKPSRATYPCQRVAFPLASGFVAWVLGLAGSAAALGKAKRLLKQSRLGPAFVCLVIATMIGVVTLVNTPEGEALADEPETLSPIGEAKGIYPGRVVWVHDPDATDWKGPGDGHPWESSHTSLTRVSQMMSRAIRELTGEVSDAAAWDKMFRYFNKTRGKGNVGYKPGEKIVIKVNFVGFIWRDRHVDPDTYELVRRKDYMNTSPQMILALLRQLVETVGVKEADIAIGDSLAYFANEYYNILHSEFPNVRYLEHTGKFGRIRMKQSSVPFYWSCHPKDCLQDYVPAAFAEADYLINMANLKAHTAAGVTLCAKNHYGSLIRWPVQKGYYDMHPSVFAQKVGVYRTLVDLMGHTHIGGKTVLYLIDGLYAGVHPIGKAPTRWKSYPFNGDWTSSLLVSQDPVAIDSVGFDFLYAEYENPSRRSGVDDYLQEAALANNPPSGTFYDPDHSGDVKRLASLGVHEHWNNPKDKQYSRNLGTGKGIELVVVAPSCADKPALVDKQGRPLIKKLGTIDCDMVEATPIVFNGRLYRFEYVRSGHWGNKTGKSYFRFVDLKSGNTTPPFASGYHLGSAFVDRDTIYVTASNRWGGQRVQIFASKDLKHWDSWTALDLPGFGIYNTSLCKADDKYVMMFEIGEPPEETGVRFTARFATSKDLKHWELMPPDCVYARDRYTAPHCLRYLDGYFYDFYLEAHKGYETRVVRSRDMAHWEPSPLNPVLRASDEDKKIANSDLTAHQREQIAKAININNSDIDFCEYKGQLIINYSWGNQKGEEYLAEAVYEGTLEQFLRGWYPQGKKETGEKTPAQTKASAEKQSIVAPGAKVIKLAGGFKFTEGPAADAEGNVFFTDQPNNRIHEWSVDGKLSIFHKNPGRANGLYFDKKGNLLACADLNNELWSIDMKGRVTVLVKGYKGKKLNGPNDLWLDPKLDPKGGIYFTDPFYRRRYWDRGPMEQDGQHVYYLSPNRKKLIRVTDDLVTPNGIIGTPDGKLLYVADLGARKTYVYSINADGTLSNKKLFCSMGSDGMTIDNEGNVYLTGKGVTVFNSAGEKIEHIDIDAGWTANVCFGDKDKQTLFITAQTSLYSLRMRVKGV